MRFVRVTQALHDRFGDQVRSHWGQLMRSPYTEQNALGIPGHNRRCGIDDELYLLRSRCIAPNPKLPLYLLDLAFRRRIPAAI
jgi:hypothetical protein